MTTRDPATNPHVGDVWEDGYGIILTVTSLHVGYLTTPDMVITDIDGYPFRFTFGYWPTMVAHGHLIGSADDPCTTSRSPSTA